MVRRERYAIAFLATTLIFVAGIFIGSEVSKAKIEGIKGLLQKDILETQSLELELSILESINSSYLCGYIDYRLPDIIKNKVELGRKFELGDVPKEDADTLQRQYSISLAKYLLFTEVQKKECGIDKPRILFFFDDKEVSREQGRVLDYIVFRTKENITIFSFNVQWDNALVRLLVNTYNITEVPTLILNGERHVGFQSRDNVTEILCRYYTFEICD